MKTCLKPSPRRAQRGSALIMAVFILTVMLLLGTVLVRTLNQEATSVGLEVTGTRTWAAAQSGLDWALARTLNRGADSATAACTAANAVLTPGSGLPDNVGFDRCTVTVSCDYRSAHGSDDVDNGFEYRAEAQCGPDSLRVSRTLEALAYD
ncbi:PilX N-terminal domain-containing pilus assembly protein [Ferrimonas balearica]|uniref:PilX N-terminal domain-containing pilus assembly protein n=1 Tax=Ferrimonas balearica TaxID=44012 RepID=UPI001C9915D4|nr:MSHA biogenesis protein MshP [Ferrimonas balearica]MBY5993126.1 MSHA biogenesis protein MshP [Ferrimonas balearica]